MKWHMRLPDGEILCRRVSKSNASSCNMLVGVNCKWCLNLASAAPGADDGATPAPGLAPGNASKGDE